MPLVIAREPVTRVVARPPRAPKIQTPTPPDPDREPFLPGDAAVLRGLVLKGGEEEGRRV